MALTPTLVWFRQDLRLQDNPAWHAALVRGAPIIPVYVLDEESEGGWKIGSAARWWLHHSLAALHDSLRECGSRLVLARGATGRVLRDLIRAVDAGAVFWNRRYEPAAVAFEQRLESVLAASGIEVKTFNASLLQEPEAIRNRQGRPFQVFTPYWRHCLTLPPRAPLKFAAESLPSPAAWPVSLRLEALELRPKVGWDAAFSRQWEPGEKGAARRLRHFIAHEMEEYAAARDVLASEGTSRLSPHLHFGEISPRQIWSAIRKAGKDSGVFPPGRGAAVFLAELGWREFAHHLLFHFPHTPERPLRERFQQFPWASDPGNAKLRAWQRGQTGYPVVDAAMRQLWSIGWMHNRARMIVASFLVKHLRLPWQKGATWFWDTLVDADLANNTLGWQWSAGCGADAAPYFRIFAPVRQGQKFDSDGEYVRRWVPELARMPSRFIHAPWTAPASVRHEAGVVLDDNYPSPIVDHAVARAEALAAFQQLGKGKA